MSIENILSQMNEITKQIAENLANPISTQQATVIDCGDIGLLTTAIINTATNLIGSIEDIIEMEEERTPINHGYIAQLQRLICILQLLIARLESFSCTEDCPDLLEELLCILAQIYILVTSLILKLLSLFTFRDASIFFECLLCELLDEVTDLEKLVKDLVCLLVSLMSCGINDCTPCYVAINSGKRPTPVPPKDVCLSHNGSNCNCKKISTRNKAVKFSPLCF